MGAGSSDGSPGPQSVVASASYIPADRDLDFLQRDELRPMRLGLELLKPELIQAEPGIRSTIVVFGSARLLEPTFARQALEQATAELQACPQDQTLQQRLAVAKRRLALARYYDIAREFGRLVSATCQLDEQCEYVIVTGEGQASWRQPPWEQRTQARNPWGSTSHSPHEQHPNPYITPDLCFQFRYFALRKMHFLLRARAPGRVPRRVRHARRTVRNARPSSRRTKPATSQSSSRAKPFGNVSSTGRCWSKKA